MKIDAVDRVLVYWSGFLRLSRCNIRSVSNQVKIRLLRINARSNKL